MNIFNTLGNALGSAANNIGANIQSGLDDISHAFESGGVAPGVAELAEQMSAGNVLSNTLEAYGVIPDNDVVREAVSAAVNFVCLNPVAVAKDIADLGAAIQREGTPKGKPAESHHVPPPDVTNANETAAGGLVGGEAPPRDPGVVNDMPNGMEAWKEVLKPGPDGGIVCTYNEEPESFVSQLPAGATFEDFVAAFMMDVVREQQKDAMGQIKKMKEANARKEQLRKAKRAMEGFEAGMKMGEAVMKTAGGPAGQAVAAVGSTMKDATVGQARGAIEDELESMNDSRQLMMEQLKNTMNKLQQMQQALSNVLNTMHQGAMNVIRNIK